MAIGNEVSRLMTEEDRQYCASQFGLDPDMVRGMRDKDWMEFFSCTKEDLPYFLIDENRWDDVEYELDALFLADEFDDDFGATDPFGPVDLGDVEPDLWDSTFGRRAWQSGGTATAPVSKPKAPAPKKVPHYYVIVR